MSDITFRAVDIYNDPSRDNCTDPFSSSTTTAIIEIGNIKIPLCRSCMESLIAQVDEFKKTVFCYKCEHFIPSHAGWEYGGSCKLDASRHGETITEKDAGYNYCTDCMSTCKDALSKEVTVTEINIFDKSEIHTDCTVEILTNSITGETSIGWWENDNPPTITTRGE